MGRKTNSRESPRNRVGRLRRVTGRYVEKEVGEVSCQVQALIRRTGEGRAGFRHGAMSHRKKRFRIKLTGKQYRKAVLYCH
eukprot:SAG11_NODE_6256_length_1351_cov_1.095048_1_plen_80_part_10